ncbi:unnamed protein product [Brassica oleracea var. botrytis]
MCCLRRQDVRGGRRDESTASISGVTREFSPVAGDCSHLRGSSSRSWMDLSFDMKSVSLAPAAAQVRKSRRGPRSRSSQYGGVILYRGTGGFDTAHAAARYHDNAYTPPLSRLEVVENIVKFGTTTLGNSYQHVLRSGFHNAKSDRAIRVSFKVIPSVFIFGLFYLIQHLATE